MLDIEKRLGSYNEFMDGLSARWVKFLMVVELVLSFGGLIFLIPVFFKAGWRWGLLGLVIWSVVCVLYKLFITRREYLVQIDLMSSYYANMLKARRCRNAKEKERSED